MSERLHDGGRLSGTLLGFSLFLGQLYFKVYFCCLQTFSTTIFFFFFGKEWNAIKMEALASSSN